MERCRECKKEVALTAKTCPHCGARNPVWKMFLGKAVLGVLFIFAIASVLCPGDWQTPSSRQRPWGSTEQTGVAPLPSHDLDLRNVSCRVGPPRYGWGEAMWVTGEIVNRGTKDYDRQSLLGRIGVQLRITFYTRSGSVIFTDETWSDLLVAGDTIPFDYSRTVDPDQVLGRCRVRIVTPMTDVQALVDRD